MSAVNGKKHRAPNRPDGYQNKNDNVLYMHMRFDRGVFREVGSAVQGAHVRGHLLRSHHEALNEG